MRPFPALPSVFLLPPPPVAPWNVSSGADWLHAEPDSRSGPGSILLAVDSNPGYYPRGASVSIGGGSLAITQPVATCAYSAGVPSLLGAGSGTVFVRVSSAATDCFAEVSVDSDWIRPAPLDRRFFTYDPNTTGRPRTETFVLAGQAYPITQEASALRAPLLVEPSVAFGMRSVFRVTYADWALTSPLTTSLIEFGDRCSCALNAWQVGEPAGLLIPGLPIRADGRHLGVMHAGQDAPPLTLVKPVEIPSSWRVAIGLWVDSRVAIGGTFRFSS